MKLTKKHGKFLEYILKMDNIGNIQLLIGISEQLNAILNVNQYEPHHRHMLNRIRTKYITEFHKYNKRQTELVGDFRTTAMDKIRNGGYKSYKSPNSYHIEGARSYGKSYMMEQMKKYVEENRVEIKTKIFPPIVWTP
jgi:hypothetical protein